MNTATSTSTATTITLNEGFFSRRITLHSIPRMANHSTAASANSTGKPQQWIAAPGRRFGLSSRAPLI